MISALKSDLRKLLSIRSTYIIIASIFGLITLFIYVGTSAATYEEAVCVETGEVLYGLDHTDERLLNASPEDVCGGQVSYNEVTINELSQDKLLYNIQESVDVAAIFIAVIVVLFMAHEFRYNTINYTLTLSNSRSKVLLSKVIATALLTIIVALASVALTVLITQVAINTKGLSLPPQDYDWTYIVLRHLGYVLGNSLLFLAIVVLVRNLTAGIAAVLLLPIIDALIGGLLSLRDIEPTKILPYSALERFSNVGADVTSNPEALRSMVETTSGPVSAMAAGLVVLVWLVSLWFIAWVLFLRRDVN